MPVSGRTSEINNGPRYLVCILLESPVNFCTSLLITALTTWNLTDLVIFLS